MYRRFLVFSSKVLIKVLRFIGKNGSALPGLIIERLDPKFLELTLKPVEKKVVLVTGTNGKTTTTKMLVAGLRGAKLRIVTNGTGSNMTRGLISALVEDMTYSGSLKPTDWYVFEMDEAYAPVFTKTISPRVVVGLNVLRDQLDRYGEIDTTAQLIGAAAARADYFVYNKLDPLLVAQSKAVSVESVAFGVDPALQDRVANEQTVHDASLMPKIVPADVVLLSADELGQGQTLVVDCGNSERYQFSIPVQGFHNALNAAATAATLEQLVPGNITAALAAISKMPTPFGRGEQLQIMGKSITVALVKNPSGFTSNLKTFVQQSADIDVILFVVNDRFADGRDVSWLWDVDLERLLPKNIPIITSGIRAYDMAVRLKQAGFTPTIDVSVPKVAEGLMDSEYGNIVIIPTYTALFEVRAALGKYGKVPRIW